MDEWEQYPIIIGWVTSEVTPKPKKKGKGKNKKRLPLGFIPNTRKSGDEEKK